MPAMRLPLLLAAALIAATPAATASASGGGAEGGALHLIELAPLTVPIVEGDRMSGRLRMKLVFDAADAEAADKITAALPALRERGLAEASEYARLYASPFVAVDAARLAGHMTTSLRAQEPSIARVLLVEVTATPA